MPFTIAPVTSYHNRLLVHPPSMDALYGVPQAPSHSPSLSQLVTRSTNQAGNRHNRGHAWPLESKESSEEGQTVHQGTSTTQGHSWGKTDMGVCQWRGWGVGGDGLNGCSSPEYLTRKDVRPASSEEEVSVLFQKSVVNLGCWFRCSQHPGSESF